MGFTVCFMLLHHMVYRGGSNFGFDLNGAYIGMTFIIFGTFNRILFPRYYRTAESYGFPVIIATLVATALAAACEVLAMISNKWVFLMEQEPILQPLVVTIGIILYVILTQRAYRLSVRSFRQVGL
jgi:hypothetical protein